MSSDAVGGVVHGGGVLVRCFSTCEPFYGSRTKQRESSADETREVMVVEMEQRVAESGDVRV